METTEQQKQIVKEKYDEIAQRNESGCGCACSGNAVEDKYFKIMADEYDQIDGYEKDADLGLGCGLPTQFAKISKGDTVIDLGSGAGNDVFVARYETGAEGKVIGIDFAESMVDKARKNAEKRNFNNVEFRLGDIEALPVNQDVADVVISNCVLNLVPSKANVFKEIFRVLKPGGHFSISDIVLKGELPESFRKEAELYVGCVSGAIQKDDYIQAVKDTGFENVVLQKEKVITLPDEMLSKYLDSDELKNFKSGNTGIHSITLYAEKPN